MADENCIFCAIASGNAPAEIVDSDRHTVAFMDINPSTRGHALVIPKVHSADLMDISGEEAPNTERWFGRRGPWHKSGKLRCPTLPKRGRV